MSNHAPSSIEIDALVDKYDKLRLPDALTPPQLLRTLHREIDKVTLPCLASLHQRSIIAYDALGEFAKHVVKADKPVIDESVRKAKRAKGTAKEIDREIEQIERELKSLPPDSPKRDQLVKALKIRVGDFELLLSRLEACRGQISSSEERIEALIPAVEDVQKRVTALRGRFTRNMFWLELAVVTSQLVIALPFAIAFVTTLAFDKSTPVLELVTARFAPKEYHEIVLLAIFGLQVLALTPVIDAMSTRLWWRNFDRTMKVVRSLSTEARAVEAELVEAENKLAVLSFNASAV